MTTERSTKILIAVFFLLAAVLVGINQAATRAPLGEWWLALVLFLIGVAFIVWAEFQRRAVEQAEAADSVAARGVMTTPSREITTPPPSDVLVVEEKTAEPAAPAKAPAQPEAPAKPQPAPEVIELSAPEAEAAPAAAPEAKPQAAAAPAGEPDDLTRVEGIGPKYRDALIAAGVTTFAQLAALSPQAIEKIVQDAGMRRTASMGTWAEQAALAAKGDWDGLAALQDSLTGGRKA